ncbi:MAG: murein L,D-transpeptidase catalytic domain family protein [Bacteroidales bacterium]
MFKKALTFSSLFALGIVLTISSLNAHSALSMSKENCSIGIDSSEQTIKTQTDSIKSLYLKTNIDKYVTYDVFKNAVQGFNKINSKQKPILTLIDFSKPSSEERLFVIDLSKQEIILSSYVSHGKNSGGNYAENFSNRNGSYQSSLGFYKTAGTYIGANGYSLLLDGLEKGFNDNARKRAIVMHGADYANPNTIKSMGRLGRSLGCPALPRSVSKKVIDIIKNGSVMYIHANNQEYLTHSKLLNS